MNRLQFLKRLTLGVTAVVVAPELLFKEKEVQSTVVPTTSRQFESPQIYSQREPKIIVIVGARRTGMSFHHHKKFHNKNILVLDYAT